MVEKLSSFILVDPSFIPRVHVGVPMMESHTLGELTLVDIAQSADCLHVVDCPVAAPDALHTTEV